MPGPTPKPTHLKILQGNPGRRRLNLEAEPQPATPPRTPAPAAALGDEARAEWERIYPILARKRLVTEADLPALAAYCVVFGRWVAAERELAATGFFVPTPNGATVQNPYLAIANRAMRLMGKFLREFGLTPASRSGIAAARGRDDGAPNRFHV